jgi:hypothetical protein
VAYSAAEHSAACLVVAAGVAAVAAYSVVCSAEVLVRAAVAGEVARHK